MSGQSKTLIHDGKGNVLLGGDPYYRIQNYLQWFNTILNNNYYNYDSSSYDLLLLSFRLQVGKLDRVLWAEIELEKFEACGVAP